jgi:elongation factor Ts
MSEEHSPGVGRASTAAPPSSEATISAKDVKELRQRTGAGVMDAKGALVESAGDIDKAIELLRVKGQAKAAKRGERAASEGLVASYLSPDERVGVLIEVNCETDFVARNDDFASFVADLAAHVAAEAPADVEALLAQTKDGKTIEDLRTDISAGTGENVVVNRFERFAPDTGLVESYVHHNGRVGVLVEVDAESEAVATSPEFTAFAKEVASHAAATGAEYVSADDVPAEAREAELKVLKDQAAEEGKPPEIQEKIAEGRMKAWLKEVALLEQVHVNADKHDGKTIEQLRGDIATSTGENVVVKRFARFQIGG